MMDGNMEIDFNYRICCLKTRKLKQKFTQYHSLISQYSSAPSLSAPQIENIIRLVMQNHLM